VSGRRASPAPWRHCTLALTVALAFAVNVQVLVLLPPLEQAPDQMASRPLETCKVIEVPVANEAVPLLPTFTLMPVGVEVTRSPLRPEAFTVSVTVWAGGGDVVVGDVVVGAAGLTLTVYVRATPS